MQRTSTNLGYVFYLYLLLERWLDPCSWKSTLLTSSPRFCCWGHKTAVSVSHPWPAAWFSQPWGILMVWPVPWTLLFRSLSGFCSSHNCTPWANKMWLPPSNPIFFFIFRPSFLLWWMLWWVCVTIAAFPCATAWWHSVKTQLMWRTRCKSVMADLCYRSPRES